MSWNEQISFRREPGGGGREKGLQLCSLGKNVRWKIDQSEAKLVPFAMFRSATRRNCRTFPWRTLLSKFAQFSFPFFFCCCFCLFLRYLLFSVLVSISWINQREFTICSKLHNWIGQRRSHSRSHSPNMTFIYRSSCEYQSQVVLQLQGSWQLEVVVGVAFIMHINGGRFDYATALHFVAQGRKVAKVVCRCHKSSARATSRIYSGYVWVSASASLSLSLSFSTPLEGHQDAKPISNSST